MGNNTTNTVKIPSNLSKEDINNWIQKYPNLLLKKGKKDIEKMNINIKIDDIKRIKTYYLSLCHESSPSLSNVIKEKSLNEDKENSTSPQSINKMTNSIFTKSSLFDITIENMTPEFLSNPKKNLELLKEEINWKINVQNIIQQAKGVLSSKYQIVMKLAHGATGSVYIANNLLSKQQVAVKLTEKTRRNIIDNWEFKNEINVWKNLIHPHIVRIFEFYETQSCFYMVSELCKFGELYDRILRGFTEKELSIIWYQLFSAWSYCHDNNIVHRDLKWENILVTNIEKLIDENMKKEIEIFWWTWIDFGTAKLFSRKRNERTVIGTSYYIAPEVLSKNYNEKCDTWSVGVILYILLVGKPPFDGKNDHEILSKIKMGKFLVDNPKYLSSSKECQDLIQKLLEVNIDKRLSARDALKHPWFVNNNSQGMLSRISDDKIKKYVDNWMNYHIKSKIQQLIISFLVHGCTQNEELTDILKIFYKFDSKHSGFLNIEDLENGLLPYVDKKVLEWRINDIFLIWDSNNNGQIEYEELLRGMISKELILSEEMLLSGFRFFDKSGSNTIILDDIRRSFLEINPKISESLFIRMFQELDVDKNGEVIFEDFKCYMRSILM